MKRLTPLALFLLSSIAALAQVVTQNPGNLTAAGTGCTTSNCVALTLPPQAALATVTLSGTFVATVQFEVSADGANFVAANAYPQPNGVLVSSATAAGTWAIPVAGMAVVRVRVSAFTSGNVTANLNVGSSPFVVPQTGANAIGTVGVTSLPASVQVTAPAQSASGSVQTPITGSNTAAAAATTASLAGTAGKTTYITGFQLSGTGATSGSIITITVTGVTGGTMSYVYVVPAGVGVAAPNLFVSFPVPVPASATNTAVVVNVPSFGAGNTNVAVTAQGFQQ